MGATDEKYLFYQLADKMVHEKNFNVLYYNKNDEEIWLEKIVQQTPLIIRIACQGFNWKKHMVEDAIKSFHSFNQRMRLMTGRGQVIFHSVYISPTTLFDPETEIKFPIETIQNKKLQQLYIHYIDEVHEENKALMDFIDLLQMSSVDLTKQRVEDTKTKEINATRSQLVKAKDKRKPLSGNVFLYGKPRIAYLLIGINIAVYLMLELNGGSTNIENLIRFGAKFNPLILEGEWWRLVTSMFLHIGPIHAFMNMFALYYLGLLVERIYGSERFLIIYLLAGIVGSLASFAFSYQISAGASGAIFGLFGALLFFGTIHRRIFMQTMGRSIVLIIFINIVFGITVPQIDMGAHLGGLIGGYIVSAMTHLPRNKSFIIQMSALIVYIAFVVGLAQVGIENSKKFMIEQQRYSIEIFEEHPHREEDPTLG